MRCLGRVVLNFSLGFRWAIFFCANNATGGSKGGGAVLTRNVVFFNNFSQTNPRRKRVEGRYAEAQNEGQSATDARLSRRGGDAGFPLGLEGGRGMDV